MINVLLVEDNRSVAMALAQATAREYELTVAQTGLNGLKQADKRDFDIIILDLNLPDMHGFEVCSILRAKGITTPILILSGEEKVMSKIKLLDAGANDYLTKPFSLGELKVRVRVLLRDNPATPIPQKTLEVGDLLLDSVKHVVERSGQAIDLRKKEFSLLECLMLHRDSVVTRQMLGTFAWQSGDKPWANTIDVHIKHLRDKVDRPFGEQLIRTVHGVGYRMNTPVPATIVSGN